jgi:hypothetical protein
MTKRGEEKIYIFIRLFYHIYTYRYISCQLLSHSKFSNIDVMPKQIYIILLRMILLISFAHGTSIESNAKDELHLSNEQLTKDHNGSKQKVPVAVDEISSNRLSKRTRKISKNPQQVFAQQMLQAHNTYRQHHCASPLKLDDKLGRSAQNYAKKLARIDKMVHSHKHGVGENLYTMISSGKLRNSNGA